MGIFKNSGIFLDVGVRIWLGFWVEGINAHSAHARLVWVRMAAQGRGGEDEEPLWKTQFETLGEPVTIHMSQVSRHVNSDSVLGPTVFIGSTERTKQFRSA